jgi:phosphotransferase system HPr-like phosphotransfer protein
MEKRMGVVHYDIVPVGSLWGVQHDGKTHGKYSTKESAFESAAAVASIAIHRGHEVQISVPSSDNSGAASKAV